jgi:hypothetical protein
MKLNDKVLHERQIVAHLDEAEINRIIIEHIAKLANIEGKALNSPEAYISCNVLTKSTATRAGEPYAEVKIVIPVLEIVPGGNN